MEKVLAPAPAPPDSALVPAPASASEVPKVSPEPRVSEKSVPSPMAQPTPLPITIGAFYATQAQSTTSPLVHGPGLFLATGESLMRQAAVWLRGQYQLPATEQGDSIGLRFETIAIRVGGSVYWPVRNQGEGSSIRGASRNLSAQLGLGADLVRLSPQPGTIDSSAALTPARWSQCLAFTGAVAGSVALHPRVWLGARLFADLLPTAVHYDLKTDGNLSTVFSPWRIRPGLAFELSLR
jgi:hypothetical protein